jgi:SnoaL-like protein
MATATRSDVQVAERFVDALGRGDWDAVEALLAPDVQLRALVLSRLREDDGLQEVVDRFRFWWAAIDGLRLLESGIEPMANQLRVHYRLAGTDPDDGPRGRTAVLPHGRGRLDREDQLGLLGLPAGGLLS